MDLKVLRKEEKDEIKKILYELLKEEKIMVLATSFEDKPWATPVIFAWDGKNKIYFLSRKSTRHAVNLEKNPQISAAIYPKVLRPLRGIQMEGKVKILKGKENLKGLKVYIKRFPTAEGRLPLKDIIEKRGEFSFFEFLIEKIFLLSEKHFGWGKREDVTFLLNSVE
ncbi:MAG: pyridoxamine 5'-phosphate oxidase family protein [candidate division WOR-3 bacterium]